jgi:hypothetical protein
MSTGILTAPDGRFVVVDLLDVGQDRRALLTEHPVEQGADITDHRQRLPYELRARAILAAEASDEEVIRRAANGLGPVNASANGRQVRGRWLTFVSVAERGLVSLTVPGLRTYTGLLIGSWSWRQVAPFDALTVDIPLREAIIVSAESVDLPPAPAPRPDYQGLTGTADRGTQPAQEVGGQRGASVLAQALDFLSGGG